MSKENQEYRPEAIYNTAAARTWLMHDFYSDLHRFRILNMWEEALESVRSIWILVHHRINKEEEKETWELYNIAFSDLRGKLIYTDLGKEQYQKGNYHYSIFRFILHIEKLIYKYGLGMPDKEDRRFSMAH